MEKNNKPAKRYKGKRRPTKKFKCELCEELVIRHKHIQVRKNYPYGKKSKPQISRSHRQCGGVLVEVKRKNAWKI